jgi:hypothetical protein
MKKIVSFVLISGLLFGGCVYATASEDLITAVDEGNLEDMEKALENGADVNATNNYGNTPLNIAVINGHTKIMNKLLDHSEINISFYKGLLSTAIIFDHPGTARSLLNRQEIDPNIKDNDGNTPLHIAAINGHLKVVKELLKYPKINANAMNNDEETPYDVATYTIKGLLLLHKAKQHPKLIAGGLTLTAIAGYITFAWLRGDLKSVENYLKRFSKEKLHLIKKKVMENFARIRKSMARFKPSQLRK